jgi:hypothetical protein
MSTPPKPYARPEPVSKDKLREMLAQAVRNTQPELNTAQVPAADSEAKRRRGRLSLRTKTASPTKRPVKGQKDRVSR